MTVFGRVHMCGTICHHWQS